MVFGNYFPSLLSAGVWILHCDPPTYNSNGAETTGTEHHSQVCGWVSLIISDVIIINGIIFLLTLISVCLPGLYNNTLSFSLCIHVSKILLKFLDLKMNYYW
jgi:hypothetical protein